MQYHTPCPTRIEECFIYGGNMISPKLEWKNATPAYIDKLLAKYCAITSVGYDVQQTLPMPSRPVCSLGLSPPRMPTVRSFLPAEDVQRRVVRFVLVP
jgi:hypothetical protein